MAKQKEWNWLMAQRSKQKWSFRMQRPRLHSSVCSKRMNFPLIFDSKSKPLTTLRLLRKSTWLWKSCRISSLADMKERVQPHIIRQPFTSTLNRCKCCTKEWLTIWMVSGAEGKCCLPQQIDDVISADLLLKWRFPPLSIEPLCRGTEIM